MVELEETDRPAILAVNAIFASIFAVAGTAFLWAANTVTRPDGKVLCAFLAGVLVASAFWLLVGGAKE